MQRTAFGTHASFSADSPQSGHLALRQNRVVIYEWDEVSTPRREQLFVIPGAPAVSEKLVALMTEGYLEERATRASRSKFDAMLATADGAPRRRWFLRGYEKLP
jgi:hypothetical protein